MAAHFKTITGANLFCDEDPGESYHLQLAEVGLPDLKRRMEEHMPGGGFMAFMVDMNMYEAFTLPFKLAGFDEGMLARVGYNDGQVHNYTIYKEILDARKRSKTRLTCVVRGQLGSYEQEKYNKQTLVGFNYEITAITSYRLTFGTQPIYDFDVFANRRGVRGTDQNEQTNAILGIV